MGEEHPGSVWLLRLAVATAAVSLLPIGLGSLVTTLGAGMAFPDWPTSDGQGMLSYPWHLSVGDKFVEHGHRLAGMVIGGFSVALCAVAWVTPATKTVRLACSSVLAAVVIQGVLGGLRVLMNATALAFGHSVFGCLVFVGLWLVVLMQTQAWRDLKNDVNSTPQLIIAYIFPIISLTQYAIGGSVRHFGRAVDLHLIGAVLVSLCSVAVVVQSRKSDCRLVRWLAWAAASVVFIQVMIGLTVWVTKYGLPEQGLVAVQNSAWQIITRTLHTITGMILVATVINWSVVVINIAGSKDTSRVSVALP